jgi:hypothetical protein
MYIFKKKVKVKMGNVLISLNEEDELLLRRLAREKHEGKKGALSEVVSEALKNLKENKNVSKEAFFVLLDKGIKSNYKMYKKRSEIYD